MKENKIIEVNGKKNKIIEIPIVKPLSIEELNIIAELQKVFPNTDFFLKIDKYKINFYLKELVLSNFEKKVKELTQRYEIKFNGSVFDEIINKILAIKSYGIKSGKRLYVDYYKERKVKGRKQKVIERGMFFYAREHNFSKKNNEFPLEFMNKILCGDSEEVLKRLPNNCVDLIFISPPYNFGLEYENHPDGINWDKYFHKLFGVFKECIRVLKYGDRML